VREEQRKTGKSKGLTFLLDEDISASMLIDYLLSKGYKLEIAEKGEPDHHYMRARLAKSRRPLFFTKDKGWLKAGAVPTHHGGVLVFDAGHLNETDLTRMVASFIAMMEGTKWVAGALVDRRFLYTGEDIQEYGRDGAVLRVTTLSGHDSVRNTGRNARSASGVHRAPCSTPLFAGWVALVLWRGIVRG